MKINKAFALPFAIMVMFIMGTLGVYSMYISSQTVNLIVDEDVQVQLELYGDSAEELSLLWLSENKQRSQKNSDINFSFEGGRYNFRVLIWDVNIDHVQESNGTVIMDILGETIVTGETKRITKRVVRKP